MKGCSLEDDECEIIFCLVVVMGYCGRISVTWCRNHYAPTGGPFQVGVTSRLLSNKVFATFRVHILGLY